MRSADITDSEVRIPREWIETIEQRKNNRIQNWPQIDAFIIKYYPHKSANAIADSAGVHHGTIGRRITHLKKVGLIK